MVKDISYNVSTLFGLGFKSFMPGTLGSAVGLIVGIAISSYTSSFFFIIYFFTLLLIAAYFLKIYQRNTGKKDSSDIIIDEYIGQQIPFLFFDLSFENICMFFIFFRMFDIIKFFPANIIDRKYKNFIGVILDDIVAGIQTVVLIYILKISII